jgi:hypothetical protein
MMCCVGEKIDTNSDVEISYSSNNTQHSTLNTSNTTQHNNCNSVRLSLERRAVNNHE